MTPSRAKAIPLIRGRLVLGVVREEGAAGDILCGLLEWGSCWQGVLWGPAAFIRGSSQTAKEGSLQNLVHSFPATPLPGVPRLLLVVGNQEGVNTEARPLSTTFPSSASFGACGSSRIMLFCSQVHVHPPPLPSSARSMLGDCQANPPLPSQLCTLQEAEGVNAAPVQSQRFFLFVLR